MAATALTIKIGNSNSLSSPTQKAALPQLPAALPQGQSVISVDESVIILDNCCKSLVSFAHNVPGISKVIQEFETLAIQLAEVSVLN